MTASVPTQEPAADDSASIRRSNRRHLIGFAVVVGMFGGVPLYELIRYFLER